MPQDLLWQDFDSMGIPSDELSERYVVKVTHGSTFNVIVNGMRPVDCEEVVAKCCKWLKAKFLPCCGEWFYGVERSLVIAERYPEGNGGELLFDYKFFCFNSEPKVIAICSDRDTGCHENVFDLGWDDIGYVGTYPKNERSVAKLACLDEMLSVAKALSSDFHHACVDLFARGDRSVFGELAFMSSAGFARFGTVETDNTMGGWLRLPYDEVA